MPTWSIYQCRLSAKGKCGVGYVLLYMKHPLFESLKRSLVFQVFWETKRFSRCRLFKMQGTMLRLGQVEGATAAGGTHEERTFKWSRVSPFQKPVCPAKSDAFVNRFVNGDGDHTILANCVDLKKKKNRYYAQRRMLPPGRQWLLSRTGSCKILSKSWIKSDRLHLFSIKFPGWVRWHQGSTSTTPIFKNGLRKKCQRKAGEPTPKIRELQNVCHGKSHHWLDLGTFNSARGNA